MKTNVKILLVGHVTGLGGADRYMLEQAQLLLKYGYDVECIAFESGSLQSTYKQQKIPCSICPIINLGEWEIYHLVKKYDFIIVNTMYAVFFAYEAQKYKPTMLILHDCLSYMKNIFSRTSRTLEELKRIRNLFGVSEYHVDMLKKIGFENVRVLNNFVEDTYSPTLLEENNNKVNFLTVANWNPVKGYDLALAAFCRLTEKEKNLIEWHIVGKMEGEGGCVKFQNEAKAEQFIIFHGEIKDKKYLQHRYIKSDIYFHLSREDACPLAVVDAAMLQKPMIVSKDTGANYLAQNGAGWIVDEYNCEDVANIIREAMKHKKEFRKMGKLARRNYLANATPEVYIHTLIRECDRIIKADRTIFNSKQILTNDNSPEKVGTNLKIALYGYNMYAQIEYFYHKKSPIYDLIGIYDIKNPEELRTIDFDFICICCVFESTIQTIMKFLTRMGIPKEKVSVGIKSILEGAGQKC